MNGNDPISDVASLLKPRCTTFRLLLAVLLCSVTGVTAVTATSNDRAIAFRSMAPTVALREPSAASESDTEPVLAGLDDKKANTKLEALNRKQVLELLGQPQRSEEIFASSSHSTIVDYYRLISHSDKHLRITYQENKVAASEVEPTPYVIPKFMGVKGENDTLTETKLRNFFHSVSDEKLHQTSARSLVKRLGKPNRSWFEAMKMGGRMRHFQFLLYYLASDGRRAFVVLFDTDSSELYEYRVQSIAG